MPTTRRLNFTERYKISSQMVEITLRQPDDDSQTPTFDVELDLSSLALPPDARIRVEAYRNRAAMRFDWGTAGNPAPPTDRRLTDVPSRPRFRVMVLDADGSGRLLALADKLTPHWQNTRSSLLEVEFTELGMEVWRLKFDENGGSPILEVNKDIDDINHAVRHDDTFRSLILPEALRAILTRALIIDGENPDDVDDGGNWTPWMRYVKEFYREEFPQVDNDADKNNAAISDWIDGAVATFATQRFRAKSFYEGAQRK